MIASENPYCRHYSLTPAQTGAAPCPRAAAARLAQPAYGMRKPLRLPHVDASGRPARQACRAVGGQRRMRQGTA